MQQRLFLLTTLTMIAFAANSIFCRLALTDNANDPLSFTLIRLASGAVILLPFVLKSHREIKLQLNLMFILPALMLFSYALFFSLSYVQMTAGTGALIAFPAAQFTMLGYAMYSGTRLQFLEKLGVVVALSGLVYLVLPGFDVPPVKASILMLLAGISWGVYSVLGKKVSSPSLSTAINFALNIPLVLVLFLIFGIHQTPMGILWAILSGALTSALGYLLWYIVLKDLKTSTAAVALLSAPAIAASGGILFLNEKLSLRLVVSSLLILGGLYIKIVGGRRTTFSATN
jgi:drug/metabolite transporter (DMT)-like permease